MGFGPAGLPALLLRERTYLNVLSLVRKLREIEITSESSFREPITRSLD